MRRFADRIKKINLSYFFIKPAAIAFYIWVIVLVFLPFSFNKYTAEVVKKEIFTVPAQKEFHFDVDGDGITEKVTIDYQKSNEFPRIFFSDNNNFIINQWNLRGQWLYFGRVYSGDYDHDNFKEIYCLTQVRDSLFLNGIEIMQKEGLNFKNRFIGTSGLFNINETDVNSLRGTMMDINRDGEDEIIFSLNSGFSKYPRRTYAYYIKKDSLVSSPNNGSGFYYRIRYMDLNDDGVEEITGLVASPQNIHYNTPYPDSSAWLMILDPANEMDFRFPPVEFEAGIASAVIPEFFQINDKKYIATTFIANSSEYSLNYFMLKLFDINGKLIKEKQIPRKNRNELNFINPGNGETSRFYLIDLKGNVYECDTSLELRLRKEHGLELDYVYMHTLYYMDADGDGKNETIAIGRTIPNKLIIYSSDLKNITSVDLPGSLYRRFWHTTQIKNSIDDSPLIHAQIENMNYNILYKKSGLYFLRYPFYISLYFLIFLLLWLLQKAQNQVAQRRYNTERLILKQQLAISKNQIEPHFMLNTLNNIGYLFMKEERAKAQYYFGKFASLINRNLQYADQVVTTLKEELKFIEDYLVLQQYRMGDEFSYDFIIDDSLDTSAIKIPHSLLFTFAENAVKHGLLSKEGAKKLMIRVYPVEERIHIEILDNGIGRKQAAEYSTNGSGKGIEIAHNILNSYNKLFNSNISFEIKDLEHGNDKINGTVVYVLI